jgi:hypothetical protein
MSAFTGPLSLTELDTDWRMWRLETPLVYEVGELGSGRTIEVPAGFITDGASVPRFLWAICPTWGSYSRAAVIHDFLGTMLMAGTPPPEGMHQTIIDRVFVEAMTVCGTNLVIRWAIWAAVRLAAKVGRRDI